MPRMNARADVLMGGGGMPGSINQRPYPFASFGRGAFRDDGTILVALVAAGGAVHAWRPLEDPDGINLTLVDGRGFNAIAGGGGRFAALEVPPPPGRPVLFGSLGDLPNAGAADVAADGTIVYKTSYHANAGLTIVDPSGLVVDRPDAFPVDYQALVGGRAVWRGGAHGRAALRPTLADAMNIRVAENVAGVDVLAYWSNAASALVVEPDGEGVGFMFVTQNGFDHDLISLNGEAILAASRTSGEGPADLVKVAITRAGLRYLVPADGNPPAWFPAPTWGPIKITPPIVIPSFKFSHRISVYPFAAAGSGRPDVFTLGTYTEAPTPPVPLPKGRLLLAHDSPADWTIPAGALRSYDLVLWELYRTPEETLAQSAARWDRQARRNLEQWPRDCGLIPMFYRQFNPATGEWLWSEAEVLDGLAYLDEIANLSPRIKVIAPFSYDRANGIKPNPNIARAFDALVVAADAAGASTLTPVPVDPPDPPDPPKPPKPRKLTKGLTMEIDGKIVQLRGAGLRLIAPDSPGTGIWGGSGNPDLKDWRGVLYVTDGASASRYRAKKIPGDRYLFTNVEADCLAGADGGQYSTGLDRQGYHKPTGNTDAGDLEQWRVYEGNEIGSVQAQIEQISDGNHPAGPGKKIVVFVLTVEIVQ